MKSLPEAELKKIANDIYENRIYTNRHMTQPEKLASVFMPIAFMDDEQHSNLKDVGMVYEYLDKAGPRSINGMPIFMSAQFLNMADALKVWDMHFKIKDMVALIQKERSNNEHKRDTV